MFAMNRDDGYSNHGLALDCSVLALALTGCVVWRRRSSLAQFCAFSRLGCNRVAAAFLYTPLVMGTFYRGG
jgi:hypothetical protein